MWTITFAVTALVGLAAASPELQRRACGDNCYNAVAATRFGQASFQARLADCSSYLRQTVTQSPVTVTITQTQLATVTGAVDDQPTPITVVRRAAPSVKALPSYATPCVNAAAYASACSCRGAKAATVTEEAETVTAIITATSFVTVQGDSPPLPTDAAGPVQTPDSKDWTSTYTYYEQELPTFAPMTPVTFPPAEPTRPCVMDAADSSAEFYLLDQRIGYLFNRNGKPGPPVAPTTQAEANAAADKVRNGQVEFLTYRFEKPAGGPAGLYDLVTGTGASKLYVALKGTAGEVIFTTASTKGAVVGRLITTLFGLTCNGHLTIQQGSTTYIWKGTDDGTLMTVGTSDNTGIVALPKDGMTKPGVQAAKSISRRGKAQQGDAPRCKNSPNDVLAVLKANPRPNNPNGCGPANGIDVVPDWNFGRCCDAHDNCYDDCNATFEECNNSFHDCMHGKCYDILNGWTWWLFPSCWGMADFYNTVVSSGQGVKAFNTANLERCDCVCPNEKPHNWAQSLCGPESGRYCLVTGGNDNNNCGGCGNTCPYKTHCSTGNCACDDDRCGNLCLSFKSHPRNCGRCGNVCASGYCYQGTCWDPPAVPDRCYPVDPFAQDASWTPIVPAGYAADIDPGNPATIIIRPVGGATPKRGYTGQARLEKTVKMCPGTNYELDFMGRYEGYKWMDGLTVGEDYGDCKVSVRLGDRTITSDRDISFNPLPDMFDAPWGDSFGPFQVSAFNEGDSGTRKDADGFSLDVTMTVSVSCAYGVVRFRDFSLHTS